MGHYGDVKSHDGDGKGDHGDGKVDDGDEKSDDSDNKGDVGFKKRDENDTKGDAKLRNLYVLSKGVRSQVIDLYKFTHLCFFLNSHYLIVFKYSRKSCHHLYKILFSCKKSRVMHPNEGSLLSELHLNFQH